MSVERAAGGTWVQRVGRDPRAHRLVPSSIPIIGFVLLALLGPLVLPYEPFEVRLLDRFLAPGATASDGSIAWLGTDNLGRDVLAQVAQGARVSLLVGAATIAIALVAGAVLGIVSGYAGGRTDGVIMRIADVQLALPSILFAILVAAALGPSLANVVIALAITRWVVFARVARASTLALREREFVDSARLLGASHLRIMVRHVLPSTMTPLVVVATVQFGLVVVAEASLSFLGLGTPAGTPSWGLTIANGRNYLSNAWWIVTMPGVALTVTVASAGLLGDAIRDLFDPYQVGSG